MITEEIKKYIRSSVLCWLATSNQENEPNVSPKEIFTPKDDKSILICNIASPISIANISQNPKVCVSFIDIFIQKGFKLKGNATIIEKDSPIFLELISFFDPLLFLLFL